MAVFRLTVRSRLVPGCGIICDRSVLSDPHTDSLMPRFAYFTLRLQVPDEPTAFVPTGVVEDLTTGEKREFAGALELLDLLGLENDPPKMQAAVEPGQSR